MKDTAAERLSKAICSLLSGIHDYCARIAKSDLRLGVCLAHPKRAFISLPTKEIDTELHNIAREHFTPLGAAGFYFYYFTPPILPEAKDKGVTTPPTVGDYQLTFDLPRFDERAERETVTRELLYCPSEQEQGGSDEWFSPQQEALRLTPQLYASLAEFEIIGLIRVQMTQHGKRIFEFFVRNYIEKDCHLGISEGERQHYKVGKKRLEVLIS